MLKEVLSLFMVAPPKGPLSAEEEELLRELPLRHFIFFKRHFEDQGAWEALRRDLRRVSPPGLWAVDQEGGPVVRILPPLCPRLKAPLELAREGDSRGAVLREARLCARAVKALGLNLNLAPVLDLAGEEAPAFLRGRTFGAEPELVAELGSLYVRAFREEGLFCAAKHFPGLGGVTVDPHKRLPIKENLRPEDLVPFRAVVREGVLAVMTTHLLVSSFDDQPATYSPRLVRFLREELSFAGLVMTDDLFMGGALEGLGLEEAVLNAFLAGHDLLLLCGPFEESLAAVRAFLKEVKGSSVLRKEVSARLSYCLLKGKVLKA